MEGKLVQSLVQLGLFWNLQRTEDIITEDKELEKNV
jgi:hypothetical protein